MESSQLNSKFAERSTAAPCLLAFLLYYLLQIPAYLAKAHEDTTANSTPVPPTTDPLRSVLALQPGRPARLDPGGRSLLRLIFPHQLRPHRGLGQPDLSDSGDFIL